MSDSNKFEIDYNYCSHNVIDFKLLIINSKSNNNNFSNHPQ